MQCSVAPHNISMKVKFICDVFMGTNAALENTLTDNIFINAFTELKKVNKSH